MLSSGYVVIERQGGFGRTIVKNALRVFAVESEESEESAGCFSKRAKECEVRRKSGEVDPSLFRWNRQAFIGKGCGLPEERDE